MHLDDTWNCFINSASQPGVSPGFFQWKLAYCNPEPLLHAFAA